MDFTRPTAVGARIAADDEQIRHGQGYDHTWVLDKEHGALGLAARLYASSTGRVMEVLTTEPGVQFYDGHLLDMPVPGLDGVPYRARGGLCLEPQRFPDSPNNAHFPSSILRPGQVSRQVSELRFSR